MFIFKKILAFIVAGAMLAVGFTVPVAATVIGTQQALAIESRQAQIDEINASFARDDVRQAMVDLGVDPEQAQLRVASLSDYELGALHGQLENLPAGGDALALIGAVFVVLMILELTGVIDIFERV